MITTELKDLLNDADRHQHRLVTVFDYAANKVDCCFGDLLARPSGNTIYLGTGDKGYFVGNAHVIIKDVSPREPYTISYRVLDNEVEVLNVILAN